MLSLLHRAAVGAVATLAMVCSALMMTSPAEATGAPNAAISTDNGVLYSGCRMHHFSFVVTVPAGSTHWNLDVDVYGPDGLEVSGDYLYGSTDNPSPGTGSVQICASELAGTYAFSTSFEWSDQDYTDHSTTLAPVRFTMRRPSTRTSIAASTTNPRYGQVVTLRVTSRDERPAGYFANRYGVVRIQRLVAGRWVTLRGGQLTTGSYGTASKRYRFVSRHRERFQAVTLTNPYYTRSASPGLVLR
jgi:hypothetical protein